MEPITTAIAAAVTAGITDICKKAFGDTYQGLQDPLKSKFGQNNKVSRAIAELEHNPESKGRQTILAESMAQEKLDRDSLRGAGRGQRRRGPGLQPGGHPVDGRRAHHKTIIVIRGQSKKEVPNEENEKFHGGA